MSDVWEGGEGGRDGEIELGEAAYGEGLFVNQAFSVERVFSMGVAALREQPALVLLAGFNLFVMQLLPQFASYPLQFLFEGMSASGSMDATMASIASSLSSVVIAFIFMPLQQLVAAGAMVGIAHWIRNGEVSIVALYTSFSAGIRALLYALLQAVILGLTALLTISPGTAVMVLLAMNGQAMIGLGVGMLLLVVGLVALAWVSLGLVLGVYAAALDGKGPTEALQISWEAANGARLTLFLVHFVFTLLAYLACCFFVLPIIGVLALQTAGLTGAWLLYARRLEETKRWAFVERNVTNLE